MERVVNFIRNSASIVEPVKNREIASALNITEVEIRKLINKARCKGIPICSTQKGYYYSEDKNEIINTIQSLMHRTIAVEKAVNGLLSVVRFGLEAEENE